MKTNKLFLAIAFIFIMGNIATNSYAQKNLEEWVKKCGITKNGVETTYISTKDPKTKKIEQRMISIDVNNKILVDDLLEACKKDKDDAFKIMEKSQNGLYILLFTNSIVIRTITPNIFLISATMEKL